MISPFSLRERLLGGAPTGALLALLLALWSCGDAAGPTDPAATLTPAEVEQQLFQLANSERRAVSLPRELSLDGELSGVARRHSEAMRDEGFFGHVGPHGETLSDRLAAAGVAYRRAGENLVRITDGVSPATRAHGLLMSSPEHRANILDPDFRRIGIGVARRQDTFWITQVFVRP